MISVQHTPGDMTHNREAWTVDSAMHACWRNWTIMLIVPFGLFLAVMIRLIATDAPANDELASTWFLGSMIFVAVGTIGSFMWRSRLFDNYYHGKSVSPGDYFKGMMIPWVTFELAGLIALTGCLLTNTLLPCIIPAMVAFVLFTTQWPKGHAMTDPVGDSDDPEVYTEPR